MNRRDERYLEDDHEAGSVPNPEVKKSRFLKKERKVELSYKDRVEEPAAPEVPRRRRKEVFPPFSSFSLFLPSWFSLCCMQAKPLPELKEPVAEEKKTEVKRSKNEPHFLSFLCPILRLRETDTASPLLTSHKTRTTCPPSQDRQQRTYQRFGF